VGEGFLGGVHTITVLYAFAIRTELNKPSTAVPNGVPAGTAVQLYEVQLLLEMQPCQIVTAGKLYNSIVV
jgi:hypothetical protein